MIRRDDDPDDGDASGVPPPRAGGEEPWLPLVERRILSAQRAGEFDRLPGEGQPLAGLDGAYDELWWVKDKLRRFELFDRFGEGRFHATLGSAVHDFLTEYSIEWQR